MAEIGRSGIHGRGLFSRRSFVPGQIILEEEPLVAMQDLRSRQEVLCCGRCLGFLDVPIPEGLSRRDVHDDLMFNGGAFTCIDCCGELYCSEECRDAHRRTHEVLCVGRVTEAEAATDPIVAFKRLAVASNEILLLAAEALQLDFEKFESFVQHPWPSVVQQGKLLRGEDVDPELSRSLDELCIDAAGLLAAAGLVVEPDRISRFIGLFEQNNIGIRFSRKVTCRKRPYPAIEEPMDSSDEEVLANDDDSPTGGTAAVQEPSDNELDSVISDNTLTTCQGTALFRLCCAANHSCVPNAKVVYPTATNSAPKHRLKANLVALTEIPAGAELTISYVDEHASTRRRQRAPADYGFICACPKCIAEPPDDDPESESDAMDSDDI